MRTPSTKNEVMLKMLKIIVSELNYDKRKNLTAGYLQANQVLFKDMS